MLVLVKVQDILMAPTYLLDGIQEAAFLIILMDLGQSLELGLLVHIISGNLNKLRRITCAFLKFKDLHI